MRRACLALAVLIVGICAAIPARADQVVLGTTKDNTLYGDPDGKFSNGAGVALFAGHTNDSDPLKTKRRGLIAFNVAASIPAGSTITAVSLQLRMSKTEAGATNVTLHRVLADWGEGASNADANEGKGADAQQNDATWLYRFYNFSNPQSSPAWSAAGGDFVSTASATTSVAGVAFYAWTSAGMVSDVQGWLNAPGTNYGWLVRGLESGTKTAKRFDTKESNPAANRPQLTVTYTPPVILGACCKPGDICVELGSSACAAQGGAWSGAGTDCSPNPCMDPRGGCCFGDGSCSSLSAIQCSTATGTYQGDGTTCVPNTCPQPLGACCADNGTCTEVTGATCSTAGGTFQGAGTTCATTECPVILTPYVDALPLPGVAQPIAGSPGGTATYRMAIRQVQQTLHSELPPTTVWGFGDGLSGAGYPGPTIEASVGQPITVEWLNDLRDGMGNLRTNHYLPVDHCLHGAMDSSPRTVIHLHGGHVPPEADGYPEATFLPGGMDTYVYPNNQLPATLWYHDHALGITRLNVTMGMAGFYLLRDGLESGLGLPAGPYEIPVAIQDRSFNPDGSLKYPEMWMEHFFGDKILVNGKVWPYHQVHQGKYRFRLLSGSTSRTYTLSFDLPGGGTVPVWLIGTEGGLRPSPLAITSLTLGPGERADVVVDFAALAPGTEVLLTNSAPAPFPGSPGVGVIPEVMKFIVQGIPGHTAALPASLRPLEVLNQGDAVISRSFELRKANDPCTGSIWLINGMHWDEIMEYPELGTTEIWSFVNRSGITHPMHMHLVMFQVLDRQDFTIVANQVVPVGPLIPADPTELGWKDTVQADPNRITRVIARFEDYTGRFPYHCHILEHEDHEMMRQFWAVDCGNGDLEPTEECDDGGTQRGDGCSRACRREQFLKWMGQAAGGSAGITVNGIVISVSTTPGQQAEDVAAALAAAINANAALQALGVVAFVRGDLLIVAGSIDGVTLADAGLTNPLCLMVTETELWWSALPAATGFDVVRGDLTDLHANGGGFTPTVTQCAADGAPGYTLGAAANPPPPRLWWYLLRSQGAGSPSYESGGPTQVGLRDPEIALSPSACPP